MAYLKRSVLLSGAITGVRFAVKSYEPSLMPRSGIDQGLITGGSFLTGFLAGAVSGRLVRFIPFFGSSSGLRLAGLATAGIRSAEMLRAQLDPEDAPHSETAGWVEMGGEIIGSLTLSGLAAEATTPFGKLTTAAAVAMGSATDVQSALSHRDDEPDARYILTSIGIAAGLNAAVAGLAGVVYLGARLPRRLSSSRGTGLVLSIVGGVATIGVLGVAMRVAGSRTLAGIEASNAQTEIAYATAPDASTVSGSTFSLAGYDTLGLQGRRLVSEITPPDAFVDVMGAPSVSDPVRTYVGMDSAISQDDRLELAIQEFRRAGGFDKSLIIAASPAGTGYVNYIAIEAAELMAMGNVATIAVQYGGLPSMLSMNRIEGATALYAELLVRLRDEIERLGRDITLVAYGESLGALTSQNGVSLASDVDELIIDAALWVGTPYGSPLFETLTEQEGTVVYDNYDHYLDSADPAQPGPRITFLNHDNDPVTKFTPADAYRMPQWLEPVNRGRGTNPYQRWLPGIALWQGLIDTKNAATVIPGEFYSTGHDYRADLAQFIRLAYGFTNVSDDQMVRIEERLRASEVRRSEAIDQGRVGS
ncbi:MAG: alpha/beta hydrolase [Actinomycetia bacterium]|nr:alpha/beta hydrolase [Actinomycetes bacterium]